MKKIWFILLSLFVFPIVTFAQENIGEDDSLAFLSTTGYFKTISVYDQNDILVDTATIKITENQYENEVILPSEYGIMRSIGESCINGIFTCTYNTEYKATTLSTNGRHINVKTTWKQIPKIKHLDTIGFVIVSSDGPITYNPSSFTVTQKYDGNIITYDGNSGNRVRKENGDGLVTNIVNTVSSSLEVELDVIIYNLPLNNTVINAAYEHAVTTTLTATEAKNFTYGNYTNDSGKSVLGGTFIYPNNVISKYDQTQGVQLVVNI